MFAKLFDVKVLRFSLGFGPRIVGFTCGETEYRLSLVPLGGYVRLLGEDPGEPIPPIDRPRALAAKPLWQRYTVVVAGPVFNLLLPLLIYFVHYAGQRTLLPPTIGTVLPDLPAANAGLLPGDRVETVDGKPRPLLGRAGATSSRTRPARRCASASGAAPTPRSATSRRSRSSAPGPLQPQGARRLDRRVAALPPARDRRARSRLAGGAGGARRRSTSSPRSTAFPSPPGPSSPRRSSAPGASPLRLNYLRGGYSAVPFAHIEIAAAGLGGGHPGRRVRRRRAPPLRDRHPVGRAVRLLGRARAAPPTRSASAAAIRSCRLDGAPLRALGSSCASSWPPPRQGLPHRAGSRRPASTTRRASARRSAPQLDAYRQEEQRLVFGALNRLAWKTEVAGPDHEPVRVRARPRVQAHRRRSSSTMVLRLRRDRPRAACR